MIRITTSPPPARVELSEDLRVRIQACMALYEQPAAATLPVLHMVQDEFGHIGLEHEIATAEAMGLPLAKIHEVVTFYSLFRSKPTGKVRIDVCQTMTCMLRGARELLDHIKERYGVEPGETSSDGRLTLRVVECLGNCEGAPVAQIGDDYHELLTPEKLDEILAAK